MPSLPFPLHLRSHRSKIIAWAFVPAALILGAVALVAYIAFQRVTAEMVMERDGQLIRVSAAQLGGELDRMVTPLEQAARVLGVTAGAREMQQLQLTRMEEAFATFDGGVLYVDGQGSVAASQPRRPTLIGDDWSSQPFYQQVRQLGRPVASDLLGISGGQGTEPAMAVSVPVMGPGGEFRGAVVGFYRLDGPGSHVFGDSAALHSEGQSYLVDSHGRVLYHSDPAEIGADYSEQPPVRALLRGEEGVLRTSDRQGRAVVAAYAPVPGSGWGLVTEELWASLITPYSGYQRSLLLLLLLGLVVPLAAVLVGVRHLMRPLRALIVATQEVARGNFGQTIAVDSGDEVETLANHFNQMSAELESTYKRLQERLEARTRELAALNTIAAVTSHSQELGEILQRGLDEALEVMELAAGGVYLLDEDEARLALTAYSGLGPDLVEAVRLLDVGEGFSGRVVAEGRPVVVADLIKDPRLTRPAARASGFHALASFPLRASGNVLGAIFVVSPQVRHFSIEDVDLLTSIGHQMGVAVENARLLRRMQQVAAHEERQRLARELHDAVTQTLFSASLIAEVLPRLWERSEEQGRARLEELRQLNRGALAEMRTLLLELRPATLTESSLPDLLRQLCEATISRSRLPVTLDVQGLPPESGLPPDVQVALYRIAQEALNNVVKHAQAGMACVTLAFSPAGLLLIVADDGRGFEPGSGRADSFGLSIMRERAAGIGADLQIESAPDQGTELAVVWVAGET